MNMTDITPEIAVDVPGCAIPIIEAKLRHAIEEFLKESLYWSVDADPIDVKAGVHTYELESPESNSVVADIIWARHDGIPLDQVSEDVLDLQWPTYKKKYPTLNSVSITPWREEVADVTACCYFMPKPRFIRIIGIPQQDSPGGLTMKVGLKTTPDAREIPDFIFEDYRETLINGALYRLLMMPSKEWTDQKSALAYKTLFDEKTGQARAERLRSFNRDDNSVIRTKSYFK